MTDKTITGTNGNVQVGASKMTGVTKWTLTKTANVSEWASSDTGGFKASKAGVKQAKGTVEFKFDSTAACPLTEGSQVTLTLSIDGTTSGAYTVPATVSEMSPTVDLDTGEVVGATANWTSNGPYTEPTFPLGQ